MSTISRRSIVKGLSFGAIILGFDPLTRSWVTEAGATPSFSGLPPLDGTCTADPAALAAIADDYGHMVHRTPVAILWPGSASDVVKMVQFARANGLRIAQRGRGHTVFGQSQVDAGVVIDMSSLAEIHSIQDRHALVDAGVIWRDLLLATTAVGRTPPVLTDFTRLTVGGTLSVGGVSGASYRRGAQVDNVLALEVVTGQGELVKCSPLEHARLFNAVLAGQGLCAIIVRAKLRLVPAREMARTHRFFYPGVLPMLADLRFLAQEKRFDQLRGNAMPSPEGWAYYIEGTSFYSANENDGDDDDDEQCELPEDPFAGLQFLPGSEQIEERTYFEHCDQLVALIDLLDQLGLGGLPHPWMDLMVPSSEIDDFAVQTMASLDPASLLPGSILLFFPFVKAKLSRPLFRVPDEPTFFLFDILHTSSPDPAAVAAALQRNRALFEQNRALGGKHYTISAVSLSALDWKRHFQPFWGALASAKHDFDPDNVLGAGPGIFP